MVAEQSGGLYMTTKVNKDMEDWEARLKKGATNMGRKKARMCYWVRIGDIAVN